MGSKSRAVRVKKCEHVIFEILSRNDASTYIPSSARLVKVRRVLRFRSDGMCKRERRHVRMEVKNRVREMRANGYPL